MASIFNFWALEDEREIAEGWIGERRVWSQGGHLGQLEYREEAMVVRTHL